MGVQNIILDIGNVICRWDAEKLIAGVFADAEQRQQALTATVGHADWLRLDRGTLALDKAIEAACQRCDLDPDKIARIYHRTAASLTPIESTVACIRELHARGIPLYVLSNMHSHCWQYLHSTYDFWTCFDGVVVSCDIQLIKPEPAIYQHILETYRLEPELTAFVDDMPVNISAANATGIQGHVLHRPDDGARLINALLE